MVWLDRLREGLTLLTLASRIIIADCGFWPTYDMYRYNSDLSNKQTCSFVPRFLYNLLSQSHVHNVKTDRKTSQLEHILGYIWRISEHLPLCWCSGCSQLSHSLDHEVPHSWLEGDDTLAMCNIAIVSPIKCEYMYYTPQLGISSFISCHFLE